MTSRNVMPGDTTKKPGPGAHSPETVSNNTTMPCGDWIIYLYTLVFMKFLCQHGNILLVISLMGQIICNG